MKNYIFNKIIIFFRFRQRECNVLIGTKVLEEGIDLPRCSLVINYNIPLSYKSYLKSKSRAKTLDAYYVLMFDEEATSSIISRLKLYKAINHVRMCLICATTIMISILLSIYEKCILFFYFRCY